MKLILVATPKKLESLLEDILSSFSYNAKKFVNSFSSSYSQNTQNLQPLNKDLNIDKPHVDTLVTPKKNTFELQEKLQIISEHLELSVPIHYVPLDQTEHLQFDIGDAPSNGSFYISHPILEDVFIRPAEFNRILAKEKETAFVKLAAALGAKIIKINSVNITQKNQVFGKKIKPSTLAPNLGIKACFDEKGELIKDIYKQYHKPKRPPYIPQDLQRWVKLDSDLRQLAHDRIELNLASVKISLQFKETKTTGTEVAMVLAGKNFEIGGKIERIQESSWQFFIEFFDKDETI